MNRFVAVERSLREATPYGLFESLQASLISSYSAISVDLLLADYGLTVLQQVGSADQPPAAVPVHSSAPGRAFGSQEPFVEGGGGGSAVVHLPVSVRGDRLGVLSVELAEEDRDTAALAELAELAVVLGHEIVVAERDTDRYLQARRRDRLTLAAEMQWQLLPGRACTRAEYAIGAHLEPAYAIHGDNFDWSSTPDHLTLTVTNGMGEGIDASLLTSLAVNALRNARRADVSLADQAALADKAVYAQYAGDRHLSVLLLRFDVIGNEVEVVDAGSPHMLLVRDGQVRRVDLDAQLPLGMAEDTVYQAQRMTVKPGDRLLFVSDGVHAAVSRSGERYGEQALERAIASSRLLPAALVPHAVLRELADYRGAVEPEDDALVVCLDWYGRD